MTAATMTTPFAAAVAILAHAIGSDHIKEY
jgi:hypothetical protein